MNLELNSTLVILAIHAVLALVSAGHALLYKRDPRSALGWIAVCLAYPIAGPLLYYLFGINRLRTRAYHLKGGSKKRLRVRNERPDELPERLPAAIGFTGLPDKLHPLVQTSTSVTHRPLVQHNRVLPFLDGESAYAAMLHAISQARHSISMTSYIFETNKSGREFIRALTAARERGVEVRVLLDGVGEFYSLPRAGSLMKKRGIHVARFIPPRILPPAVHINLRNHRKLLIVDNTVGFTGGMNIGDRHLRDPVSGQARTVDIHFQLNGPIIAQLQKVFDEDWHFVTGETERPVNDPADSDATAVCRVITDGPNEDLGKLAMIITGAVSLARHRVAIMTPYFLPPAELISALQAANLRGVEVSIILPQKSNHPLVHWAMRNMLWELLQFGVNVYYQPPPFAHSKLLLVDDYYAQIGSANLDPRSLRLNFELVVEVFDQAFVARMDEHFETVKSHCVQETLSGVDGRRLPVRIRDALAWLFSPYL